MGIKVRRGRIRNEKEWYACDRCGAEMKGWTKTSFINYNFGRLNPVEVEVRLAEMNEIKVLADMHGCASVTHCEEERKVIRLCGKCRKEFERFMRNENNIS